MFKDFQDPKMRGEKFTWNKFPRLVAGIAEVSCYQSFSHRAKDMDSLEKICKNSAFNRAGQLVKENNLN